MEVYTNTVCTIYIKDGNCTKELANLESIGEKRCYSENEIRNLNSQVKNGISIDEFFTFFDKNKVAVYAVSLEKGKENTKIEFSSKELPFTAYYSFENDRLVDRNLA